MSRVDFITTILTDDITLAGDDKTSAIMTTFDANTTAKLRLGVEKEKVINYSMYYITTSLISILLINCIACTVNTTEQSFILKSSV